MIKVELTVGQWVYCMTVFLGSRWDSVISSEWYIVFAQKKDESDTLIVFVKTAVTGILGLYFSILKEMHKHTNPISNNNNSNLTS